MKGPAETSLKKTRNTRGRPSSSVCPFCHPFRASPVHHASRKTSPETPPMQFPVIIIFMESRAAMRASSLEGDCSSQDTTDECTSEYKGARAEGCNDRLAAGP